MSSTSTTDLSGVPFKAPGQGAGLLDVVRRRYLLSLLVKKELRVRYRGSVLGMLWSYVRPAVQLLVFYLAMGKFLGLEKAMPNYIIYLFSGMVMVNFFNEVFANTTRAVTQNADLVKKIYLPRELFPVSSVWVAFVHFVPQLLVLLVAALFGGWRPGPLNLAFGALSVVVVAVLGLGLGLFFGALNVIFRDWENIVDLIIMMATWFSPVLYTWERVRRELSEPLWFLYQLNPLTPAVEMAHYAWWLPSTSLDAGTAMPPHWARWGLLATVVSLAILAIGQYVFRRLEGRFAQEL